MIVCLGMPIILTATLISYAPWYIVLHMMVTFGTKQGWFHGNLRTIYDALVWWITPERLAFYFIIQIVKRCFVPVLYLAVVISIKWLIIGKFEPMGFEDKSKPWNRFKYYIFSKLLPLSAVNQVASLVGTHYEIISVIYRSLGAKIGKRIYWPGSGLDIVEYDLLEVGDDVVFGSRSLIMTSSAINSKPIVFEAGSMIADRCVVLPGVRVRRGAVLGSGTLTSEDMDLPVGSVWVGSQGGSAVNVVSEDASYAIKDTITPFGRAFYERKASYFVLPLWFIIIFNTLWQGFITW